MLVISRQSVFPIASGSEMYSFDFLQYAAASGWKIHCVITNKDFAGGAPIFSVPPEVFRVMKVHVTGCVRVGNSFIRPRLWFREKAKAILRKFLPGKFAPRKFRTSWKWHAADAAEQKLAAKWIERTKPDVVLANYCWMTPCFPKKKSPNAPLKAVLTHDVMHQASATYTAAGLANNDSHYGDTAERELLQQADVVLAISDEDASAFRNLLNDTEVITLVKGFRITQSNAPVVKGRCFFVGSDFLGNSQGLAWFFERIWPSVRETMPNAHLRICGKICQKLHPQPGVELLGVRENLDEEYESAAAVIVPLQVGSGVKIKLLEAISHGKACVTTSIGMQGLGFLRPQDVSVAESAEDFAARLIRILSDDAVRISLEKNALAAALEYLAPEKVYSPALKRLEMRSASISSK